MADDEAGKATAWTWLDELRLRLWTFGPINNLKNIIYEYRIGMRKLPWRN